jgi:EmrB/QacA subfamily drug resistance transporter
MSSLTIEVTVAQNQDRLSRGTILALAAMAVAIFIIANDFTALSVAIPEIEKDLDTSLTTAQWVINGYMLVFGVLIVTGGRLDDMFGRKKMFIIGAIIFAGFSLLGGLAPNAAGLLGCRALMGVGGALMWPAVLGMTYAILPDSKAGLAGGLVLGVAGFGNAVGPLLGGFLTDVLSWRWIFFVNVPIAAFGILVIAKKVPESTGDTATREIDYRGIALVSLGLLSLLFALDEGPDVGWGDPEIVVLFILAGLFLAGFALLEPRMGDAALIPRDVMANRPFAISCVTVLLMSAIFFSALLYLPQFMVKVLDFSALRSGAGLIPMMGVFALSSFVAGPLYARVGPKIIVSFGAACLAIGMFLLSFINADSSYASLVPGLVVLGVGVGVFYSSITTAGVTALDASRTSLAGGIIYMCQIAGGAVGLGLNTAIVTSASTLTDGISNAFLFDTVLALVGLTIAVFFVGGTVHLERLAALRGHQRAHA